MHYEAYDLADYLVGPFSDEQRDDSDTTEPLEPWQISYYRVAVDSLRRIIKQDEIPEGYMPSPLEGAELYRELAPERKFHKMIKSLGAFIDDYKTGVSPTNLRQHQQEIFDDLYSKITQNGFEEDLVVKSATGTGKTAILTTLIQALKYGEEPTNPVRSLVLVPTKDILGQTIKAFKQFTDIEPGVYFGEEKNLQDTTVMTYRSFDIAVRNGTLTRDMYDVVVKDEVHESGGKKVSKSLEDYCTDPETGRRKAVFGLSATPKETENLAHDSNLIEAIDRGILSPVQIRSHKTGARIQEQERFKKREDYAPEELAELINNDPRNEIIIREILSGLSGGRRVAVRCLPGGKLLHPTLLSELVNRLTTTIQDPYTGDKAHRKIRSVVIDGDMPQKKRQLIYNIFNDPFRDGSEGIDLLFFVDTLVTGWDSPIAKKIVNSCPSRSRRRVEQLFGRSTRPFERMDGSLVHAEVVDLEDESASGQVLFEHVVEEYTPGKRYVKGAIIGPGLVDLRYSDGRSAFEAISEEELRAALESDGANTHRIRRSKKAASTALSSFEADLRNVSDSIANNPFDSATSITTADFANYTSIADFAESLGLDEETIEDAIMDKGTPLGIYRDVEGTEAYYIPQVQQSRLRLFIEKNY